MTDIPRFGAVYISPQNVEKLSKSRELGFPKTDFTKPDNYNQAAHQRFNAAIAGALRSTVNDPSLHIGSHFTGERTLAKDCKLSSQQASGAIILVTRADAMPSSDPLLANQYGRNHPDELALVQALRASRIPYERGSYVTLYNKTRLNND